MKQNIDYKNPDLKLLLKMVEVISGVKNISRKSRNETLKNLRFVYMKLAKKYTKCSSAQIGHVCGGMDHASVLHGVKRFDALYETPKFSFEADVYNQIVVILGSTIAYRNQNINYRERLINYIDRHKGLVKRMNYKVRRLRGEEVLHRVCHLDEEDYNDVKLRIESFLSMKRIKSKYNFQNQ